MEMKKYLKPSVNVSDVSFIEDFAEGSLEGLAEGSIFSNWLQMPDDWNNLEGDPGFN